MLAILLAVAVLGVGGVSIYVGWNLTHPERKPLDTNPSAYGLVYEEVVFPAADDEVLLRGWFMPTPLSEKTIIITHGFRGNRLEDGVPALGLAQALVADGFNVLIFDFRNNGESEGTVTTLGYHEVKDVLGAVTYMKDHRPDAGRHLGIVGYSMGAVTASLAAAREPALEAAVFDSPFADLRTYLQANMSHWTGLPHFPFTHTILLALPPLIGLDPSAVSPLAIMPRLHQPVLLIHAAGDDAIPYSNSEQLAAAGDASTVELWIVEAAGHPGARQANPAAYDTRVVQFLRQHVGEHAGR